MAQINVHGQNISVGGQQVIQQVEAVTEEGGDEKEGNVCVGGTQVINKYASPTHDGDSEVKRRSQHKAWTTTCTVVKEHVLKHQVTTIIGSPGEGKTTTGYLVMNDFLKRRWRTFVPKTPQEYFSHSMVGRTIVLLNDIFGTFEYDEICLKGWLHVFDDIRSHSLKSSDGEEPETSSVKYIIISRDYILREAEHKLGKFIHNIFTKVNIIDISTSVEARLNLDDKLQIINVMMGEHGRKLSKDFIERIIKAPTPHGFPHCAELMFTLQDTRKDPGAFFREPLVFLKDTIKQLCDDVIKRHVFCLLLKHGGEMSLYKTTEQLQEAGKGLIPDHIMDTFDVHTFKKTCYVLHGPYLQIEEDRIKFSHPSVLQSVAVNLGCDFPELLIKHCHMSVLKDILRHGFEPSESYVDVTHGIIQIVVDRFAKELCNGNMIHVLSHVLLQWKEMVVKLLTCSDIPKDLPEQLNKATGESCLYLASSNKKSVFLEELLRRFPMTKLNLVNALFGCCEFGNSSGASCILSSNQENFHKERNKDGETFLLVAARNGHTDVCRVVLPCLGNVDLGNKQGDTALHLAAEQGNTDLIILLIEQVNNMDQMNKKMETALHKALLGGHLDASKKLLESEADFTKTESMGLTALHCACYTGLSEIVQILVGKGCDIHALNKRGSHAIMKAAESGHTEIVELLHNAGCSLHRSNNAGYTCLHFAGQNGHIDTVKFLLRSGCDINARSQIGRTPLMQTAIGNQLEVLKILVENGADINAVDIVGFNSLMVSIGAIFSDGALFLLERGANIHLRVVMTVPNGLKCLYFQLLEGWPRNFILCLLQVSKMMERFFPQSTLSPLEASVITGQKDVMVNILEQGENPGENLLHHSCECAYICNFGDFVIAAGNVLPWVSNAFDKSVIARLKHVCAPDVAQELIQRGVDVNAFDSNGFAPLHLTAANGHTGMLKVLLDSNDCLINTRSRKDKETPLHVAVGNNNTEAVNLLLTHQCEVNSKDISGRSPIHLACEMGNPIVLQNLLAHGADANIQDQKGNTPLHYAAWKGHLVSVLFLMYASNVLDMPNRYSFRAVDYAYVRCKTDTGRVLEQRFPPRSLGRWCKLQLLKAVFANPIVYFILDNPVKTLCLYMLFVLVTIGCMLAFKSIFSCQ